MSRWADTRNFITKLTLRKFWNLSRVTASYYLSKITRKPVQWGLPFTIAIEPTTSCNLRCPECPSGLRSFSRPTGRLDRQLLEQIVDHYGDMMVYLYFYFQGEPYLHPEFTRMVRYASSKGIYTVTSTNAHFLNDERARNTVESGLDRLIISIDGVTQQSYSSYRVGGKLEKVIEGARNIIKWRKKLNAATPHVIFQFLVVRQNEHEIPMIYQLAEEIGVDEVVLKTVQIYDYKNGSPLMPENEKYSRYYRLPDGTYRIKNALHNHCWKLWHSCVITWDGQVVPCCFDKDAQHAMGNVREVPLEHIWYNGKYHAFREKILKARSQIDICTNCTEGMQVWLKPD